MNYQSKPAALFASMARQGDYEYKRERLASYIREYHRGEAKAISRADLCAYLFNSTAGDISNNNMHDRMLRNMIEELNRDFGAVICSSTKGGYFWADKLTEALTCSNTALARAKTIRQNAEALAENARRQFGNQLSF